MRKLKFLLADDHPMVRQGLKSIIDTFGLTDEILEVSNGRDVIELSLLTPIDLFLLDYRMPVQNGYDTAKILLKRNPLCKIMMVTAYSEADLISNLLALGVRGFLSKNTDIEEIELAIKKVLAGEIYLNDILEERIHRELNYGRNLSPITFTNRENDLIAFLSKGMTSKDISQSLGLSLKTIETYRSRLLEKVGAKNSSELVSFFHCNGLV